MPRDRKKLAIPGDAQDLFGTGTQCILFELCPVLSMTGISQLKFLYIFLREHQF